jgi:hypothetical protein
MNNNKSNIDFIEKLRIFFLKKNNPSKVNFYKIVVIFIILIILIFLETILQETKLIIIGYIAVYILLFLFCLLFLIVCIPICIKKNEHGE